MKEIENLLKKEFGIDTYSNGDEIKVNDGNTFVQVMPSDYDIVVN